MKASLDSQRDAGKVQVPAPAAAQSPLTTATSLEPTSVPGHPDPLWDLRIVSASGVAPSATRPAKLSSETEAKPATTPTEATELKVGEAVRNHRIGYDQEDRHLVRPFPLMNPEEAQEYLRLSVATIDAVTKDNISGSTFTGVIVTQDGNLVTAHLGDSPASAIIIGKDGDLKHVERLIVDHRPAESETEKEGRSLSGRIFYDQRGRRQADDYDISINLTHALGNAAFGDVLSHTPEVAFHDMQKLLQEGDRLLLLVTSDGAHNETRSITHQTHAPTIASGLMRNWSLADISDQIAANSRLIRDNVTVTLLEVERGKGAVIAIFDGHGGSETSDQAQRIFLNLTERFAQQDKPASIEALASTVALEERL